MIWLTWITGICDGGAQPISVVRVGPSRGCPIASGPAGWRCHARSPPMHVGAPGGDRTVQEGRRCARPTRRSPSMAVPPRPPLPATWPRRAGSRPDHRSHRRRAGIRRMLHRAPTLRAEPVGRYIGGLGNAGVTVTRGMRCLPAVPSGRSRCLSYLYPASPHLTTTGCATAAPPAPRQ